MPRSPSPRPPRKRKRNAAATRAAILSSARRAFARAGYDGAGVREIAHDAGVTAMLINRYFGSKEQLFAEAVVAVMQEPTILTRDNLQAADFAHRIARLLVDITDARSPPLEGFQIMMYSAASPTAARIARAQIEQHYHATLSAALRGPHAPQRAALVLALVAGVQAMRQMLGLPALADAEPQVLVDLLAPLLAQLVGGPTGGQSGGQSGG